MYLHYVIIICIIMTYYQLFRLLLLYVLSWLTTVYYSISIILTIKKPVDGRRDKIAGLYCVTATFGLVRPCRKSPVLYYMYVTTDLYYVLCIIVFSNVMPPVHCTVHVQYTRRIMYMANLRIWWIYHTICNLIFNSVK